MADKNNNIYTPARNETNFHLLMSPSGFVGVPPQTKL